MSTVDLVKSAQSREYIAFEDKALGMLKSKLIDNPVMQEKLVKLNVAQGLTESDDDEDDKDDDKDDMKDKKDKKDKKGKMKDKKDDHDEPDGDEDDDDEDDEDEDDE